MVELTVSKRHVNQDASAENQWEEDRKIILSGFDALHSTITQTVDFPRYDHMGHEVEYKVEETDIREITMEPLSVEDDAGGQQTPVQQVQTDQGMRTVRKFVLPMNQRTLDEESIEGATDYFVSTSTTTVETDQDGMTHHKTVIINELEGETAYFIRKTWDMNPSNVTFTLSQTGKNGTSIYGSEEIKTTDYTTDSPRDSGWIRGEWDGESWELPRYDEDGNLYTYMVLEQDNNSYESEYIYGSEVEDKDGNKVFVYGHDVDGDGKPERNAAKIHNSPIGLNRHINVRKVWYDDSANTDRGPVKFQIETLSPSRVIYGENGLLGSYIEVNEQSNWWDKVDVTMFLHGGVLYTSEDFATGFKMGEGNNIYYACFAKWSSADVKPQVAFEATAKFNSVIRTSRVDFDFADCQGAYLKVATAGGAGQILWPMIGGKDNMADTTYTTYIPENIGVVER
jgi:hypothetical protein